MRAMLTQITLRMIPTNKDPPPQLEGRQGQTQEIRTRASWRKTKRLQEVTPSSSYSANSNCDCFELGRFSDRAPQEPRRQRVSAGNDENKTSFRDRPELKKICSTFKERRRASVERNQSIPSWSPTTSAEVHRYPATELSKTQKRMRSTTLANPSCYEKRVQEVA